MSDIGDALNANLGTIGAGAAGVLVGAAVGYAVGSASSKKKRSSKRKVRKSNNRRKKRKVKYEYHRKGSKYGSSKQYRRKGGKSVRYTKNGQPYIILNSGKARFIKGRRRKR